MNQYNPLKYSKNNNDKKANSIYIMKENKKIQELHDKMTNKTSRITSIMSDEEYLNQLRSVDAKIIKKNEKLKTNKK